ncbi:3',5'-cyclic-nucleotide phosphodiesterase [Kaarinaea lacus]
MELTVLGCSGGVGQSLRTTTMRLNRDVLIDAGTGLGDLSLSEMAEIRHIFLTHSHLDHIASIPLLVDSIFDRIQEPIVIHGLEATIQALRTHIFNNVIWPDFAILPNRENPVIRYEVMMPGQIVEVSDLSIEMIPINHVVPGVGYRVANDKKVFAFSGDTTTNDTFWQVLNQYEQLDMLIVEAAFPNKDIDLCRRAGHYCPSLLAADIAKLRHRPEIYISHNKPGAEDEIFRQCQEDIRDYSINRLTAGSKFTL